MEEIRNIGTSNKANSKLKLTYQKQFWWFTTTTVYDQDTKQAKSA